MQILIIKVQLLYKDTMDLNAKFLDDRDRALLELEKEFKDILNKFIDPDYEERLYEKVVSNYLT